MATRILSNYTVSSRHQLCSLADRETRRDKKEGGGRVERRKRGDVYKGGGCRPSPTFATRCAIRALLRNEKNQRDEEVARSRERDVTPAGKEISSSKDFERDLPTTTMVEEQRTKKKEARRVNVPYGSRNEEQNGRIKSGGGKRRKRKLARRTLRVGGHNNAKVSTRGPEENDRGDMFAKRVLAN